MDATEPVQRGGKPVPPRLAVLLPTLERLCAIADAGTATAALELPLIDSVMRPGTRDDLRALLLRAAAELDLTHQPVRSLAPVPSEVIRDRPIVLPMPLAVRRRLSAAPDSGGHAGTRWAAAAVVIAATAACTGVAAATTQALPGDALYGVKRQVESVHLSLAHGDLARGRVLLAEADARLAETEHLAARTGHRPGPARSTRTATGDHALVSTTLRDLGTAWSGGIEKMTAAYRRSGDLAPLHMLGRAVRDQQARLAALSRRLAPADRASAQKLAGQLSSLHAQLDDVLPAAEADPASADDPDSTSLDSAVVSDPAAASADGARASTTDPSTTPASGTSSDTTPGPAPAPAGVDTAVSSDPGTIGPGTTGTPVGGASSGGTLPAPAPLPATSVDPLPAPAPPVDPAASPAVPVTVDPGAAVAVAASGVVAGVTSTGTP